jgi:hypothetical protein
MFLECVASLVEGNFTFCPTQQATTTRHRPPHESRIELDENQNPEKPVDGK